MVRLSSKEIPVAKCFLKALFYGGRITKDYIWNYFFLDDCQDICDEIINRQFNFVKNKLDNCLANLSMRQFRGPSGGKIKRSSVDLARYIAWFCSENDIKWDDSIIAIPEIEAAKTTLLGKTLFDAGCFASTPAASAPAATTTTTAARAASTKAPGTPPVNGYKSSGGHSKDIPNLIGTPGAKTTLSSGSFVYCIEANKIGKNTPNAFITPLKQDLTVVSKIKAEEVKFGSGNGYTDCKCWFDTQAKATDFLAKCQTKFGGKFINIHIAKAYADSNGYFQVSTEFGNALIKASRLNEELEESLKSSIQDIDLYNEWMHKSIS